jgi:integrase
MQTQDTWDTRDTSKTGASKKQIFVWGWLNSHISTMFLSRRPKDFKADDLVFLAARGNAIDLTYFREEVWTKILAGKGVPYKNPYRTRHTFICHALEAGLKPSVVAEMTGHDLETLFKHYASYIPGYIEIPTLF